MSVDEKMQLFVERIYASGVARPGDLRGCSAAEITAMEQRYNVAFPRSYVLFLSHMGHATGKLGNLGEFDLSYRDALKLTEETLESWQRSSAESFRNYASLFPHHGFVFCVRDGNPHYWLIICEGQEDSPVIRFDYDDEPVRFTQTQESLFGFLEELRADAEHWIREGTL